MVTRNGNFMVKREWGGDRSRIPILCGSELLTFVSIDLAKVTKILKQGTLKTTPVSYFPILRFTGCRRCNRSGLVGTKVVNK